MHITDICTRNVVVIEAGATIRDAAERMRHRHVGSLVVVDAPKGEFHPVGMLTDRDIVVSVVAADADPGTLRVGDVMSRGICSCGAEDDLVSVLQSMRLHGVRRMPVTTVDGELHGLVSIDDVIAAIGRELGDVSAALIRGQVNVMQRRE